MTNIFNNISKALNPICRLLIGLVLLCFIILPWTVEGTRRRPNFEEDYTILLREIMDSLDTLRNDVQIHDSQMGTFEEKFKNLEEIIDSLRQETNSSTQAVKETLKYHSSHLDAKLSDQQNTAKGLSNEVKSLANDNLQVLNDFKKRISDLEKSIDLQNRNIENLQAALSSIIDVIKNKEAIVDKIESTPSEIEAKTYKVKAGDSLEKIARNNQTTIKKLKEANNLTSDQIIVGQKLKIPE